MSSKSKGPKESTGLRKVRGTLRRARVALRKGYSSEWLSKVQLPHSSLLLASGGDNLFSDVHVGIISANEGGTATKMYVPSINSGPTIAMGLDLGQTKVENLLGMGLSEDVVKKLVPYVGMTGKAASDYVTKHPLNIKLDEANQINDVVLPTFFNETAGTYDGATQIGTKFADLPWQAQTVIADLWYNFGDTFPSKAPNFWKQVNTGEWDKAFANLQHFVTSGDDKVLEKRAFKDSFILKEAIDEGKLPT